MYDVSGMRTLTSCRGINLKTRLRAIKGYVWPTLFYGEETRTITKSLLSRLDAFDMWICRRVLKIPWTDKITKEEVQIGKDGNKQGNFRGRPSTTWVTDLTNSTGLEPSITN